jgi:hypothetical protein
VYVIAFQPGLAKRVREASPVAAQRILLDEVGRMVNLVDASGPQHCLLAKVLPARGSL